MKILIISQYFWPENFQINWLAKALVVRNHQVTVLTGLPNYPGGKIYNGYKRILPSKEYWCGVEIIRVPLIPRGAGSRIKLALNYLSYALFATCLSPFLCQSKSDVMLVYQPSPITQAFPATFLRWLRKIPVCMWVQDIWPESLVATKKVKSPHFIKLVDKLVSFVYRHTDINFVQSKAFFPYIERYGIPIKKIQYLPNTTDEFYKPLCLLPDSDINKKLPNGFRIMFAGNIGSAQAISTILNAAEKLKQYPDIKWIFIGEGSERGYLQQCIVEKQLQDSVTCLGSYPPTEMPYLFAAADVLLVSLNKSEIFSLTIPSKIQSYLASGKPILAALDGEGARIVEEANAGLTAPAEDSEKLALAVVNFYSKSAGEREKLGINGYFYFHKHFSQTKLLNTLEHSLKQLI